MEVLAVFVKFAVDFFVIKLRVELSREGQMDSKSGACSVSPLKSMIFLTLALGNDKVLYLCSLFERLYVPEKI